MFNINFETRKKEIAKNKFESVAKNCGTDHCVGDTYGAERFCNRKMFDRLLTANSTRRVDFSRLNDHREASIIHSTMIGIFTNIHLLGKSTSTVRQSQ